VLRLARWRHLNAVCAYTWRHRASGKEIDVFLLFIGFRLIFWPQLNIKALHNLKTKSLGINLTPRLCLCQFLHFKYFWILK